MIHHLIFNHLFLICLQTIPTCIGIALIFFFIKISQYLKDWEMGQKPFLSPNPHPVFILLSSLMICINFWNQSMGTFLKSMVHLSQTELEIVTRDQ